MKSLYLRSCVALVCAAGLAACGGSGGNLVLGGQVVGLIRDGLIITNKGVDLTLPMGTTAFSFPDLIGANTDFDIQVKTDPPGMTCTPVNAKGTTSTFAVSGIGIICAAKPRRLGGAISGQTSKLVLVNGSDTVEVAADATSFEFRQTVGDGLPYGISVFQPPVGQTCSVTNPSARIGAFNLVGTTPDPAKNEVASPVAVTCVTTP